MFDFSLYYGVCLKICGTSPFPWHERYLSTFTNILDVIQNDEQQDSHELIATQGYFISELRKICDYTNAKVCKKLDHYLKSI